MNKQEFLETLKQELFGLPEREVEERLAFYSEMIDDRLEEGQTEEEAVLVIGTVNGIAAEIIASIPFSRIAKERIKPRRALAAWEIALLALGSPLWLSLALSLAITAAAVVFSLYAVLFSLVISVWAVVLSLAAAGVAGVAAGVAIIVAGHGLSGLCLIGAAVASAGLAIFLFFGGKVITRGTLWLSKKMAFCIKKFFIKKEKK